MVLSGHPNVSRAHHASLNRLASGQRHAKACRWVVQLHPLLEQVCEKRALRPQLRVECSADVLFLQGDFSQALMELMAPQLNATATALNHFALNGTLGSAIQNSAARSDDPAILSCLSVRISRPASQLEKGVGLHKTFSPACTELQPGAAAWCGQCRICCAGYGGPVQS